MIRVLRGGEEETLTFATCLLDALGLHDKDTHPHVALDQFVVTEQADNELGLCVNLRLAEPNAGVLLGHSPRCPARMMKLRQVSLEPTLHDVPARRIPRVQIGVVVLIEAHDAGSVIIFSCLTNQKSKTNYNRRKEDPHHTAPRRCFHLSFGLGPAWWSC